MKSKAKGKRKAYRSPHLVTYGSLRRLTKGKGGKKSDGGGAPKSKVGTE
jgi:hypothetical protein